MGALPPTFKNAANPLVHEQMQAQYGLDTETDEIRKAEREQVRERSLEDYNISTMDNAKAESTGRIGSGASAIAQREAHARQSEQRNKENTDMQIQMAAMRAAGDMAAAARERAEGFEEDFEEEFGTDWRQDIALRVFEPDEFPERREGESIEDYNARLEEELIDKMIDPETGQIRPEYKDDPELGRYGEWAKARHQEREAEAYMDAKRVPEHERTLEQIARVDKMEESPAFDQAMQTKQESEAQNIRTVEVDAAIDDHINERRVGVDLNAGMDAF